MVYEIASRAHLLAWQQRGIPRKKNDDREQALLAKQILLLSKFAKNHRRDLVGLFRV